MEYFFFFQMPQTAIISITTKMRILRFFLFFFFLFFYYNIVAFLTTMHLPINLHQYRFEFLAKVKPEKRKEEIFPQINSWHSIEFCLFFYLAFAFFRPVSFLSFLLILKYAKAAVTCLNMQIQYLSMSKSNKRK